MTKTEGQTTSVGLDTLTRVVALILAIVTPFLSYMQYHENQNFKRQQSEITKTQQRLERRLKVERQRLEGQVAQSQFVDQLLTRMEKYLDKLGTLKDEKSAGQEHTASTNEGAAVSGLDEKDKLRIMISLSKIAVESHLERKQGGETQAQKALLREIPVRFALLAEDDSMLVAMSKSEFEIKPWADFAEHTASSTIKKTAAKALERIALTTDSSELQLRKSILNRLIKLARDTTELDRNRKNDATDSLVRVFVSFKDESMDAPDEMKKEIAKAALFLEGTGLMMQPDMDVPRGLAPSQITEAHQTDGHLGESNTSPARPTVSRATAIAQEADIDSEEIKILIEQLDSDDKYLRRPARDKLASMGLYAVAPMMTKFTEVEASYRIRLGVLVALTTILRNDKDLAPQVSEKLTPEDLGHLAKEIDVNDRTMRQYATEFLFDLGDKRIVVPALRVAKDTKSDQSRYQAIYVIHGAYSSLDREPKAQAAASLQQLKRENTPDTNELIDGILSLASFNQIR